MHVDDIQEGQTYTRSDGSANWARGEGDAGVGQGQW
jgi:hypothetical protein